MIAFFFFKQKTAYEIRKGDWSSDVCSSDLTACSTHRRPVEQAVVGHRRLEPARRGDIGPVDRPVRERVRAQPRSLRDVAGDVGPRTLSHLFHGGGNLALEEGPQLLLGVGESEVA